MVGVRGLGVAVARARGAKGMVAVETGWAEEGWG